MNHKTIYRTIEYLNHVAGTDYIPDFEPTVKLLTHLIDIGYGYEDFKQVIDKKWEHWKGTKYQVYVRPQTLFGEKFENYKNEQRPKKHTNISKLADSVEQAKQFYRGLDKK